MKESKNENKAKSGRTAQKQNEKAINHLSHRLKSERKSQGLSQTDLAQLSGVSLNFLSQLEMGKTTVRLDKVLQVMMTLGLEFHVVYGKAGIK